MLDPAKGYSRGTAVRRWLGSSGVESDQYGIAVTDAGEDLLRRFVASVHRRWMTLKPLPLGTGPGVVVLGGQPESLEIDLYIANAGSGTVTALRRMGRRDIPVGGQPIGVVARPSMTGVLDQTDYLALDNDDLDTRNLVAPETRRTGQRFHTQRMSE